MLNSLRSTHADAAARSRPWLAGLLSIGVMVLWLVHGWANAPVITNDGYQYLDTASSIVSEGCFCTHMAHFDEQLHIGYLPVPMTHFSPGYPLLIVGISAFGLTGESAGYLISVVGFLITIWLMWDVGRAFGARPLLAFVFVLPWIGHRDALVYASAVLGESIFSSVLMGMVALIVRDLKTDCRHPTLLAGIGGLAGAAYFVRYAGFSLIPPALLYLLWRFLRRREARVWALAGLCAAGVFVIPIQIRNIVYSGSWRGLPAADAPRSLLSGVVTFVVSLYHLVLGDFHPVPIGIWVGLCVLSIPCAFLLAFRAWQRGAWGRKLEFAPVALTWIGLIGILYTAGTIAATLGNANMDLVPINLVRYYVPLYPVLLSGIAGAVSLIPSQVLRLAAGALALIVATLHGVNFKVRPDPQEQVVMAGNLQKEVAPGQSLRRWLLDRVPERQAIVAEEGQVLGYLLHRATVTPMEPPEFSNLPYDAATFRFLMAQYRSRYLLLFPVMRPSQYSLPFLSGLIAGTHPEWLKLRVRTSDIVIYECDACAR